MSNNRHKIEFKQLRPLLLLIPLIGAFIFVLEGCAWDRRDDTDSTLSQISEEFEERDPLPGELVRQTILEDSLLSANKRELKKAMTGIISDTQKKFRQEYFTGYFITDLDNDNLPELWVKTGTYRENSRLELYYPLSDGSMVYSETPAEPGKYYLGDNYIIQVVGSGPGFLSINKITINNGQMEVENMRDIDLYKNPELAIPKFKEPEIRNYALTNVSPLHSMLQ